MVFDMGLLRVGKDTCIPYAVSLSSDIMEELYGVERSRLEEVGSYQVVVRARSEEMMIVVLFTCHERGCEVHL